MTDRRGMTPADLFRIRWLSDVALAPDGGSAVFVVTTLDEQADEYHAALWSVATGGDDLRQLTFGPKRDRAPSFSPDGRLLAFVRDLRGKENREARPQLWLGRTDGGEAWPLTDLPNGAGRAVWSPDGRSIVFTSRVSPEDALSKDEKEKQRARARVIERVRYRMNGEGFTYDRPAKLWCVPVAESGPQTAARLTDADGSETDPEWSPDGAMIAFVSSRDTLDTENTRQIWLIAAAGTGDGAPAVGGWLGADATGVNAPNSEQGGEPRRLTDTPGPKSGPRWSPDGRSLAYLGHEHATGGGFNTKLWLVDVQGGEPRCLTTEFDHTIADGSLQWSADGRSLLFLCQDQGAVHLYRIAATGGTPERLIGGDRQVTSYDVRGERIAFTASTASDPTEVFLLHEGVERRLTDLNRDWKDDVARPEPEAIWFTSEDGTRVQGWLVKPVGFRDGGRYPVLYNIHGGPHAQSGYGFLDEFQVQAGAGFGVFFINFRGSTGYGEHFAESVNGNTGVLDYQDLIAGLDALVQVPWADPDRIGVLGGSYGGYMTSWLIGHCDRFAAACSERAVNNWLSKVGTSDIGFMQHREIGAEPWEDPLHYLQRSPIFYVKQIRTPVLIIHSENDLRCPIEQAEQLFTALKLQGVETRFVRFPEENHELSRAGKPSRRVQRFEEQLAWFGRHLRAREAVAAGVAKAAEGDI